MSNALWILGTAVVSFLITYLLGKKLIPFLRKLKFGQTILDEGPSWHKDKQGTPTMGGIMFILSIVLTTSIGFVLYMFFGVNANTSQEIFLKEKLFIPAGLIMALLYGFVGFIDDYIKVAKKQNLGLSAIQKLIMQFAIAIGYLGFLAYNGNGTGTYIPFVGIVDLGYFYYIIAAIVIVGFVNAVNLTDGIDGLVGSVTFFVSIFLLLIASYLQFMGLTIECAAIAGACLGFLVWNFNPAKVFMGDTGSLFFGGILCAVAFGLGYPILLVPMGIMYIIEMFSVMLQVVYFKLTKGKRLFKMSPIHHHFEMSGWSEFKIVSVFSIITAVAGLLSFIVVVVG